MINPIHVRWASLFVLDMLFAGALAPDLRAQATMSEWRGTIEQIIGDARHADFGGFGRISGLAVDRAGRVFVADDADQQIFVFSPEGKYVGSTGRRGGGPLEFKRIRAIAVARQDLVIRDEGNARVARVRIEPRPFTWAGSVPLVQFASGQYFPIFMLADGSFYDEGAIPTSDGIRPTRIHRGADGGILRVDTLRVPPGAFDGVFKSVTEQRSPSGQIIGVNERIVTQPFGARWLRAYGPNGLRADVVTSVYEVRILDERERLVTTVKRAVAAVPLSTRESKVAQRTLSASPIKPPFSVPAVKPPIAAINWSRDGKLWVERSSMDGQARVADVYDAAGKLVMVASWPDTVDLLGGMPWIVGDSAWTVMSDEDGTQRVVRLRFHDSRRPTQARTKSGATSN